MKIIKSNSVITKGLVVFSFILIAVSCQDSELIVMPKPPGGGGGGPIWTPPPPSISTIDLSSYRNVLANLNSYNFNETDEYVGTYENFAYFNYERLTRDAITTLNSSFNIPNLNMSQFAQQVASDLNYQVTYSGVPFALEQQYPQLKQFMNSTQLSLLDTYFNNMYQATSTATTESYYNTAKTSVNSNTSLNNDQKILVLGFIEQVNNYMKGFFSGGSQTIYIDITTQTGLSASGPCSIRVRDVLRAGVEAGAANAVRGAIIGATAGTFSVPVLGTASGGVGGAVFGFAAGFVGGAAANAGWQTFWNCLMRSPHQQPDTRCEDPTFMQRNLDYCLRNAMADKKIWVKLTDVTG